MRITIFISLFLFFFFVETETQIVDVHIEDAKECEDNMKVFNTFCPEGNRCLSKVKEAIECIIETLKDISFDMDNESILAKMEEEIKTVNDSFNEKIESLENEIKSLQEEKEKIINETTIAEHIVIETPEIPQEEFNISEVFIQDTKHQSSEDEFYITENETQIADSPCLYVSRQEDKFLLTANLGYETAKQCCYENEATPYIPKSQSDFVLQILKITSGARFGWIPLNDLADGTPSWEDGTSLFNNSFVPRFTSNPDYSTNHNNKHCVGATSSGLAYWVSCEAMMKMLCILN